MNDPDAAPAEDLAARLRDAEVALRGLHRRVLDAERELADARRDLAREQAARQDAEARLEALQATKAGRSLQAPRRIYRKLRDEA